MTTNRPPLAGGIISLRPYQAEVVERTRAGVKAAQSRGVKFGRKPKLSGQQLAHARKLIEAGEPVPQVAKLLSVDRATVYRALQRAA